MSINTNGSQNNCNVTEEGSKGQKPGEGGCCNPVWGNTQDKHSIEILIGTRTDLFIYLTFHIFKY